MSAWKSLVKRTAAYLVAAAGNAWAQKTRLAPDPSPTVRKPYRYLLAFVIGGFIFFGELPAGGPPAENPAAAGDAQAAVAGGAAVAAGAIEHTKHPAGPSVALAAVAGGAVAAADAAPPFDRAKHLAEGIEERSRWSLAALAASRLAVAILYRLSGYTVRIRFHAVLGGLGSTFVLMGFLLPMPMSTPVGVIMLVLGHGLNAYNEKLGVEVAISQSTVKS